MPTGEDMVSMFIFLPRQPCGLLTRAPHSDYCKKEKGGGLRKSRRELGDLDNVESRGGFGCFEASGSYNVEVTQMQSTHAQPLQSLLPHIVAVYAYPSVTCSWLACNALKQPRK